MCVCLEGGTLDTQEVSFSCLEAEAASTVSGEPKCWMSSARASISKFNVFLSNSREGTKEGWEPVEGSCIFHAVLLL